MVSIRRWIQYDGSDNLLSPRCFMPRHLIQPIRRQHSHQSDTLPLSCHVCLVSFQRWFLFWTASLLTQRVCFTWPLLLVSEQTHIPINAQSGTTHTVHLKIVRTFHFVLSACWIFPAARQNPASHHLFQFETTHPNPSGF